MLMLFFIFFIEWISFMMTMSNNFSKFHSKSKFNSCLSFVMSWNFFHFFWTFDSCRFVHVWNVIKIIRKTLFIISKSKNSCLANNLSKIFRSISIEFCKNMFLMNSWKIQKLNIFEHTLSNVFIHWLIKKIDRINKTNLKSIRFWKNKTK